MYLQRIKLHKIYNSVVALNHIRKKKNGGGNFVNIIIINGVENSGFLVS